jgi:hypothetical protein
MLAGRMAHPRQTHILISMSSDVFGQYWPRLYSRPRDGLSTCTLARPAQNKRPSDVASVLGQVEAEFLEAEKRKWLRRPPKYGERASQSRPSAQKFPRIGWHIASSPMEPSPSARVDRNCQGRRHTKKRWGLATTITLVQSLDQLHEHDRRYAKPARPSVQSDRRQGSQSRDIDADPVSAEGLPGRRSRLSEAQFCLLGEAVPSNSRTPFQLGEARMTRSDS